MPPPVPERVVPGRGELVLIVDDEPEFRELLELWVSRHGWRTATAADGLEVMRRFEEEAPDLVLLDLNLPGMDGWEVTEWIRRVSSVPILMVTAMGSESDIVRGLRQRRRRLSHQAHPDGRAGRQGRRRPASRAASRAPARDDPIEHPGLLIEPATHRVVGEATEVHLTPTEFRLWSPWRAAGRPADHAELLRGVWGPTYGEETQVLRVTMRNLRAKLAVAAPGRTYIVTEYGLGYRFQPG